MIAIVYVKYKVFLDNFLGILRPPAYLILGGF